jgi:hypothetical protein
MGVDFNRISSGISSGTSSNGFGTIVSYPSGGGGCPAAGTPTGSVSTQTYEAGSSVYVTELSTSYKNQNADFSVLNNGTCGTYVSTTSPTNIVYKPNGSLIVFGSWYTYTAGSTVTVLGTNYYNQEARDGYAHDGSGGYYESEAANVQYIAANTFIVSEPEVFPVPEVGGSNYSTGRSTYYLHNGEGGTTSYLTGDYYAAGTLIWQNVTSTGTVELPNMNTYTSTYYGTRYEWNGSGVYWEYTTWYVPYGTFIESYDGYTYRHDGAGGYYQVPD